MRTVVRGREIYAHALAVSSTDGKFYARDIAAKTDAAAREGCYERGGADKKRGSADLLTKEQRAVRMQFKRLIARATPKNS